MTKRAMAIAAHPDDIEFMMAGTLILLKESGYEIHYMTLSDGNCGSMTLSVTSLLIFPLLLYPVRTTELRRAIRSTFLEALNGFLLPILG